MIQPVNEVQGDGTDALLHRTRAQLQRLSLVVVEAIERVERDEQVNLAEVEKRVRSLDALQTLALKQEWRIDELQRQREGRRAGLALDLHSARVEIGRRLALLRDADGGGPVP